MDYTGEILLKFRGLPFCKPYKIGERIGQLMVVKKNKLEFEEVNNLESTERGEGGFGSTGS